MEQSPEELPMDQVLDEIRLMLMAESDSQNKQKATALDSPIRVSDIITQNESPKPDSVEKIAVKPPEPAYFLLTPAMRCDLPSDEVLSETVQRQLQRVMTKMQAQKQETDKISPELIAWLNTHLPALVEKVVSEKLGK